MKLKPLQDRIVVKRIEPEKTSAGGIVLPDAARPKQAQGEVLAVGPGLPLPSGQMVVPTVEAGQVVFFEPFAGHEVQLGAEKLTVLREADIIGVVTQ